MTLGRSRARLVHIEICTADASGLLTAINQKNIPVFDVRAPEALLIRLSVAKEDYPAVCALLASRAEDYKIIELRGLLWKMAGIFTRPILMLSLLLLILLSLFMPTRILFVTVTGNTQISDREILSAAEACGVRFGTRRREIKSEKVKNALLSKLPQLQWAGVNTSGCVASISVKERQVQMPSSVTDAVEGIVAVSDGIIRKMTVTSGNGLCTTGQAVKKGQLLISAYTDCGLYIRSEAASGEVYADTIRKMELVTPLNYRFRQAKRDRKVNYSLIIGKKVIKFYKDSGISDTTCVKMYREYPLQLWKGFPLPLCFVVEVQQAYDTKEAQLPQETDFDWIAAYADEYLRRQMIAGAILEKRQQHRDVRSLRKYTLEYNCYEMIGRAYNEVKSLNYGKGN